MKTSAAALKTVFPPGPEGAARLDAEDPLKDFQARFYRPEGRLYFDGNSLGLCSREAEEAVLAVLEAWKTKGIDLWSAEGGGYLLYPSRLGAALAGLLGADPEEVTVANSTTVNLHQALATFYRPTKERWRIVVDELNFPTDRHAVDSQVRLHGLDPAEAVTVVPSADGRTTSEDDVVAAFTGDTALALLPSVLYRSAQLLDMARITAEARARGLIIGWDLCHSIGAVPHDFKSLGPDFAVWCNYKYLSAGPGAAAGLYLNRRHFGRRPGLAGWFGHDKSTQFRMDPRHRPSADADAWLTGTPPLLAMAALEGSLKIFREAGLDRLRAKSLRLTAYLMELTETRLAGRGFAIAGPREDHRRGGHVALAHREAYRLCLALKAREVTPDFREPDVIRLCPAPLYVSFGEVYRLVDILAEIMDNREYERFEHTRSLVV